MPTNRVTPGDDGGFKGAGPAQEPVDDSDDDSDVSSIDAKAKTVTSEDEICGWNCCGLGESMIYAIYLFFFTIVFFSARPGVEAFDLTMAATDSFMDNSAYKASKVSDLSGFMDWMDASTLPLLYPNGPILDQNHQIGAVQLRQVRTDNTSCEVAAMFQDKVQSCYVEVEPETESKKPLHRSVKGAAAATAFVWAEGTTVAYSGKFGSVFSKDGYIQNFMTTNLTVNREVLQNLRDNNWLDRGTRAIFVDFSLYNANKDYYVIVTICFEFSPTGALAYSQAFRTLQLFPYDNGTDMVNATFKMGAEAIFFAFLMYYIVVEIREMRRKPRKVYWGSLWNWIEWANALVMVGVVYNRYVAVNAIYAMKPKIVSASPAVFLPLQTLARMVQTELSTLAFNSFLVYLKVFKYINHLPRIGILALTVQRASMDLGLFLIMMGIVLFAMAAAFWMAFGGILPNYQTLFDSLFTLIRMAIGDFDYGELERTHYVLGPLLFIIYLVLVFFFLLNMVLAIIAQAHAEVMEEEGKKQFDFSKMKRRFTNMRKALSFSSKQIEEFADDMEFADTDGDGMVDEGELEQILAKHGGISNMLQSANAKELLAKYDVNGDGQLDADEMKMLMADIKAKMDDAANEEDMDSSMAKDMEMMQGLMSGGGDGMAESMAFKAAQSSSQLASRVGDMESKMASVSGNQETMLKLMDEVMGKVNTVLSRDQIAGQILASTQNFGVLERNPETTLRALDKYDFTNSATHQPGGNPAAFRSAGGGGSTDNSRD